MSLPQLKDLLEAGVHFGHQTKRWNPKMRRFIFAERNGIYIIDLQKTMEHLEEAKKLITSIVVEGKSVLFVGTKRQIQSIVREEAERCGMFYVTNRWLGGMLTNFQTIRKSIRRLRELEKVKEGEFEGRPKKEILRLEREREKLDKVIGGIKDMSVIPGAVFLVDAKKERIAVAEGNRLNIPLVAIVDTNSDPDLVTIPIAGNDDAIRAVRLITRVVSDAVLEGLAAREEAIAVEEKKTQVEIDERESAVKAK